MDELAAYRRKILAGYTIAGVLTSFALLFAFTSDMLKEIPIPKALGYLAVMIFPMIIGEIISKSVTSTEDGWTPMAHWPALRAKAPLTIGGIALVVLIDVLLHQAELNWLMVFPPILLGLLLKFW